MRHHLLCGKAGFPAGIRVSSTAEQTSNLERHRCRFGMLSVRLGFTCIFQCKASPTSGQLPKGGLRTAAAVAATAFHTCTSLDGFGTAAIYPLYLMLLLWADTPHQHHHHRNHQENLLHATEPNDWATSGQLPKGGPQGLSRGGMRTVTSWGCYRLCTWATLFLVQQSVPR